MNGLLITNIDNTESKSYAIYYTNEERFYVIYTKKEKDENGYVILHIAKVLKEVNSTPEGIIPTGRFIGLEISDPAEWDSAKLDISAIISNKQSNTPINVKYLDVKDINGISIKSSKIFKLREDVVNSIIVEEPEEPVTPVLEKPFVAPIAEEPVIAPVVEEPVTEASAVEENIGMPAMAPNPFAFNAIPVAEEPVIAPVSQEANPYEEMMKKRDEEMVNALANDSMQDIVPEPAIPVESLERKVEEMPTLDDITPLNMDEEITPIATDAITPVMPEAPAPFEFNKVPVAEEITNLVKEEEVQSSESFVDSIVADVSDIVDNNEEDSDYKKLYEEELGKTVELEKELKALHSKLNNIKDIIE